MCSGSRALAGPFIEPIHGAPHYAKNEKENLSDAEIREGQGLTREQFAERYGLQVRAIQEWEQGRRKPEPAVRAYMLVIKNQPAAVRKALTAA
jgi:DNA-binding transcriptional regulator YiaG